MTVTVSSENARPQRVGFRREAIVVAAIAAAAYLLSARIFGHLKSPGVAYFDQLADSFLHGRVHLKNPASTHDLTMHNGKWYVPFPPLAAVLMMPFVAVFGVTGMSTVVFSAVLGGINAGLVHRLLHRIAAAGIAPLSARSRRWLIVMWTFGTVHWYIAVQGSVWFVAHVCAVTFVLWALCCSVEKRPLLAGVLLGVAALSRPTTLLLAPALFGLANASDGADERSAGGTALRIVGSAAVVGVGLLLTYNYLRFGRLTEFGYRGENVARELAPDLAAFGQFNVHFIPHNIWAMVFAGPRWAAELNRADPDPYGMSMLLTTPALLYAFRASWSRRAVHNSAIRWCWLGIGLCLIPLLTYYNTGWYQFGYRFSMDFLPVLLVLVAVGVSRRKELSMRGYVAICFGVAMNLWGLIWFTQ
jgi:hypothetical protein